jgi:hypothetical protein
MPPNAGLQRITRQDLQDHRLTVPGVSDEQYAPLYDFANYPAAGITQLLFFTTPQGGGVSTAPGAPVGAFKSEADTNLVVAGMLPRDQWFFITGIEILVFPGLNPGRGAALDASAGQFINDVWTLGKSGFLKLKIGTRDYVVDGPLMVFPTTQGIGGTSAIASATTAGASLMGIIDYARFVGQPYTTVGLWITPTQNFSVSLNWPGLVPTFSTTICRLGIRLRGRFGRAAQ